MRLPLLVVIAFTATAAFSVWAWRSDRPQHLRLQLQDGSSVDVALHTEWAARNDAGIRREIRFVPRTGQQEVVGDYWEVNSHSRIRAELWGQTPVVFADAAGPVAYLFARVPSGHWLKSTFNGGFTAAHAPDRTVTLNCWPEKPPIKTYRLSEDGSALDLVAATEEPSS